MHPNKISAGGSIRCRDKKAVLGAIIKFDGYNYALTVYHLLKVGKCGVGDSVEVEGWPGIVKEIIFNMDLAIIAVDAPENEIVFSNLGNPKIGYAYSLNGSTKNPCRIMTLGTTYHYLAYPFSSIPVPGDSGSPIIQNSKVVGILASVFYNNATAIAVSIERFMGERNDS